MFIELFRMHGTYNVKFVKVLLKEIIKTVLQILLKSCINGYKQIMLKNSRCKRYGFKTKPSLHYTLMIFPVQPTQIF